MKEPQDAGEYQVGNDGPVQGQVIGGYMTVNRYFILYRINMCHITFNIDT